MRLFFAVPLDDSLREALAGVQERLKAADAHVRWVEPSTLHLTVGFLGDRPDAQLADVEAVGASVAGTTAPFRIGLRGGSYFPRRGPIVKTVWVGVAEGAAAWKALAQRAESLTAPLGVPPGNELIPHITLGRVKSDRGNDALRAALAAEAETDCGSQAVDRLVLVQSFLHPTGAVYQNRNTWHFNAV